MREFNEVIELLTKAKVVMIGGAILPERMRVVLIQMTKDLQEVMIKFDVNNNIALFDRIEKLLALEKSQKGPTV